MEIVSRVSQMQTIARRAVCGEQKIGLVPTMGALHEGHLSLTRRARQMSDLVVVSIFVNPLQFGPQEDYQRYPRNLAQDAELLSKEQVDYLFAPSQDEVYPEGFGTYVAVEKLSERLCGVSRPGHFRGVTTVVCKLLNITDPAFAFFGQKDAQQAIILRKMVRDLNLPVEVVICPTVREEDGLALSSRNRYLDPKQRRAATVLYCSLQEAERMVREGETRTKNILQRMAEILGEEPLVRLDYSAIVNADELEPLDKIEGKALVAVAAYVGPARLIDNVIVEPNAPSMVHR
ncbi:MAG: pantoate--beta-alanine ligase [Acidobacteria bacterium]|nr:pantoate--beta-alanine ligase [Acidobacteriota bacterium]